MAPNARVGDTVTCLLYNTPEGRFYGQPWQATILEIDHKHYTGQSYTPYLVTRDIGPIWLKPKEVMSDEPRSK